MTTAAERTDRARVRRHPERGSLDRLLVHAILDEGFVAHVGFAADAQPFVIPMAYGRAGDRLILHGAAPSRLMDALAAGVQACVTVTLVDGLVLARSTFSHSMNYRSVVCFGRAHRLEADDEKRRALDALVEHLIPGRSREARGPNARELDATAVLEFAIEEASAKVRSGPPKEPPADVDLPVWAGVIPLAIAAAEPEPAPDLAGGIPQPGYVTNYRRPRAG